MQKHIFRSIIDLHECSSLIFSDTQNSVPNPPTSTPATEMKHRIQEYKWIKYMMMAHILDAHENTV